MNLRALLVPDVDRRASVALLLVRAATGLLLVPHGYAKLIQGPAGLAAGLLAKGLPMPSLLSWCATLAELVGGLCLALGLLSRPAAVILTFNMVVAWATSHLGNVPDIGTSKGAPFEYPFLLSVTSLAIAIAGPGRYSADAVLVRGR